MSTIIDGPAIRAPEPGAEQRLQLVDPDHPQAQEAAEATARLLMFLCEQRARTTNREGDDPCPERSLRQAS